MKSMSKYRQIIFFVLGTSALIGIAMLIMNANNIRREAEANATATQWMTDAEFAWQACETADSIASEQAIIGRLFALERTNNKGSANPIRPLLGPDSYSSVRHPMHNDDYSDNASNAVGVLCVETSYESIQECHYSTSGQFAVLDRRRATSRVTLLEWPSQNLIARTSLTDYPLPCPDELMTDKFEITRSGKPNITDWLISYWTNE